jgi:mono/diheme cytochrome c family protein
MQLTLQQTNGRVIFYQRCHQCHPGGEAGLAPALNNKPAPQFLMETQVRAGLGAMPRFDEHTITPAQLDDLMDYMLALRKADKRPKEEVMVISDTPKRVTPLTMPRSTTTDSKPIRPTK